MSPESVPMPAVRAGSHPEGQVDGQLETSYGDAQQGGGDVKGGTDQGRSSRI